MQADKFQPKSRKRLRGTGTDSNGEQGLSDDTSAAKTYSIRSRRTQSKPSMSQVLDEHSNEKPSSQTTDSHVGNRLMSLRPSPVSQNATNQSNTSKPSSEGGTPTSTPTSTPTLAVKELQQLLSQYVQRQRANLASSGGISPITNPTVSPVVTSKGSNLATGNAKPFVDSPSLQKSTIIANKFSNAINKYTINHPTSSHYAANDSKHSHEAYTNSTHIPPHYRPTSTLDRNAPVLSVQYKEKQKEKRLRSDYDDSASSGSEGSNYFLLAAQHELQNMDEELNSLKKIELLELELEHLRRGVAMRDRVIRKLHEELEEKDTISKLIHT